MLSRCFFVKQKTAYEMRISDWSSDVCSSDLPDMGVLQQDVGERLHLGLGIGGAGRVGRAVQDQPLGPGRDRRLEILRQQLEAVIRRARQIGRASCRERVCQYV